MITTPTSSTGCYAGFVLLGATLFGQTTVSTEHAYPYTPSEAAEVIRGLHHLLAAGLSLIMGKRGKSPGIGAILRFLRNRISDSFWGCRRLPISMVCRTPS
jgi:hypothetical protein